MWGCYCHVPFCVSRCSYCDFTSQRRDEASVLQWRRALAREVEAAADAVGDAPADTLFIGGGTPTALSPAAVAETVALFKSRFRLTPGAEVTVEANPESFTEEMAQATADAGVNRLSLGVQTFDDAVLRTLGRRHDAAAAEEALWRARAVGFGNCSLDLIYGLPETTLAGWREDIARALALRPNHLSLYALTLEPGVPLSRDRARYRFPDDDEVAAMYYAARDDIVAAGYVQYEISNFARPGYECRHNLKYWRDEDWLGFGPSAAGHWRGQRYRNPAALAAYAAAAAAGRWPLGDAEPSDPYREMRTAFVLGLRLAAGVDVGAFARRYGVDPSAYFEAELGELTAAGLLETGDGRVRLTREGLFLSDEVFARLI